MCSSSAKAVFSTTVSKMMFFACGQVAVYGNYEQRKRKEMHSFPFTDQTESSTGNILILILTIYLYDDYFTLIISAKRKPRSIKNIPLDEIDLRSVEIPIHMRVVHS